MYFNKRNLLHWADVNLPITRTSNFPELESLTVIVALYRIKLCEKVDNYTIDFVNYYF